MQAVLDERSVQRGVSEKTWIDGDHKDARRPPLRVSSGRYGCACHGWTIVANHRQAAEQRGCQCEPISLVACEQSAQWQHRTAFVVVLRVDARRSMAIDDAVRRKRLAGRPGDVDLADRNARHG